MNVEFKAISKYFQDQTALENINFHDDVSSLAIIGPSGGGKSTLLRIMGGLILPSHGELFVDG
jgi:polar amino acid transport system ATP-binding protein